VATERNHEPLKSSALSKDRLGKLLDLDENIPLEGTTFEPDLFVCFGELNNNPVRETMRGAASRTAQAEIFRRVRDEDVPLQWLEASAGYLRGLCRYAL
jgi:hypothetical protein